MKNAPARLRELAEQLDWGSEGFENRSQYICDNLGESNHRQARDKLYSLGMGQSCSEFADADNPPVQDYVRTEAKQNARVLWLLFAADVLEDGLGE